MATTCNSFTYLLAKPSKYLIISRPPQFSIKIKSFPKLLPHRHPLSSLSVSCASKPSISLSSHDNTPTLLRYCANGAAALLVGSLLLVGRFVIRPAPALAVAFPKSSSAATLDETREQVDWRCLVALSNELMVELPKSTGLWKILYLLIKAWIVLQLVIPKNLDGSAVLKMLNNALEIARREKRVKDVRNLQILIAQMHVVKQGDLKKALRQFQDLVKEDPRDFRPYLCQGVIYGFLNKEKQACKQFETYWRLMPDKKD